MFAMSGLRAFSLAAEPAGGAVSCGVNGVFVGDVPLLQAAGGGAGAKRQWSVRPASELNEELSAQYGLPIDVAAKANALALIAAAFNRGDLAMAAIATVQMQFPDPPPLTKGRETEDEIARRALELHRSRLLKFWDPAKHPRTGTPPNPGWFAPESGEAERPVPTKPESITVLPAAMVGGPWKKPPIIGGGGGGGGGFGGGPPRLFPDDVARPPVEAPPEPAAPASGSPEPEPATTPRSGGRLGGPATRAQNAAIAADLKDRGYVITGGGGVESEEYIPGPGPRGLGGTYVDITAVNPETGAVTRVQTIDTLADGSPTPREAAAADRIRAKYPNDTLILIPKRRSP
jgi:hypothetical protein